MKKFPEGRIRITRDRELYKVLMGGKPADLEEVELHFSHPRQPRCEEFDSMEFAALGGNYHMTGFQMAILIAVLAKMPE